MICIYFNVKHEKFDIISLFHPCIGSSQFGRFSTLNHSNYSQTTDWKSKLMEIIAYPSSVCNWIIEIITKSCTTLRKPVHLHNSDWCNLFNKNQIKFKSNVGKVLHFQIKLKFNWFKSTPLSYINFFLIKFITQNLWFHFLFYSFLINGILLWFAHFHF